MLIGLPWCLSSKESVPMQETGVQPPGLGRLPGEGKGNPLQYSCLGNPGTAEPGGLQFMGSQKILDTT